MTLITDRPTRVLRVRGILLTGAVGVATAALLAACGGGSTATTTAGASESSASGPKSVTATGNAAAPGQNGQGGQAGAGGAQFQKIQECLTAAGVSLPTPTGGPGGAPPSGAPTDGMSGAPTDDMSGAPGGGPGGGDGGRAGQMFSDPTVQAALKACGLTVPTGGPQPGATATATS